MEKIAAGLIVAFAAFCVVWAFIKQLRTGGDKSSGGCSGDCCGCTAAKKKEITDKICEKRK